MPTLGARLRRSLLDPGTFSSLMCSLAAFGWAAGLWIGAPSVERAISIVPVITALGGDQPGHIVVASWMTLAFVLPIVGITTGAESVLAATVFLHLGTWGALCVASYLRTDLLSPACTTNSCFFLLAFRAGIGFTRSAWLKRQA
jgi:hypothetical protein